MPEIVTIFRSRLGPDAVENGYGEVSEDIEQRAYAMPGFISHDFVMSEDGERVSIVVFDSWDSHEAWRKDPEHRRVQELGRTKFYASYDISVCERVKRSTFAR